jgi:bacterioferritin-associated ferredoxin
MIHPLIASSTNADLNEGWHDRVQIALAIADEGLLRSLLVDSTPPLAQSHRIGGIQSAIGVPVASGVVADGSIEFEQIHCERAASPEQLEQGVAAYSRLKGNHRGYLDLIRYETETQVLGQAISMSHAISLLTHVGFATAEIQAILNLPYDAWHKSWWHLADETGAFTVPFLRLLRTRRYADGTYTLQYKDFYADEQPSCFRSCNRKVLIEIMPERHEFAATLAKINSARQQLGVENALLICNQISDLEARGFISQKISLYAAQEIVLPVHSDCAACATQNCPMRGNADSPVLLCQRFCLTPE